MNDKKLIVAAEKFAQSIDPLNKTIEKQHDIMFGFKEGAKSPAAEKYWKEKNENYAIEFAEWIEENYYKSVANGLWTINEKKYYTTIELYELFKTETTKK